MLLPPLAAVAVVLALAGPARAAHVDVDAFTSLPKRVLMAQTVWDLDYRAGLALKATTYVSADTCKGQPGYLVTADFTDISGRRPAAELRVVEQPAVLCDVVNLAGYGVVQRLRIPDAAVTMFARCGWSALLGRPLPGFGWEQTCPPRSVRDDGGLLLVRQTGKTAAAQMSSVAVISTDLTYEQLRAVALGLRPVV